MSEKGHSEESEAKSNPIFMCYFGSERSGAMQRMYEESGLNADTFPGGAKRMAWMAPEDIKKEIGGRHLFYICDNGRLERSTYGRVKDLLDRAGVDYQVLDQSAMYIMANNLGKDLGDYLV